jgi:hypothetical protein
LIDLWILRYLGTYIFRETKHKDILKRNSKNMHDKKIKNKKTVNLELE